MRAGLHTHQREQFGSLLHSLLQSRAVGAVTVLRSPPDRPVPYTTSFPLLLLMVTSADRPDVITGPLAAVNTLQVGVEPLTVKLNSVQSALAVQDAEQAVAAAIREVEGGEGGAGMMRGTLYSDVVKRPPDTATGMVGQVEGEGSVMLNRLQAHSRDTVGKGVNITLGTSQEDLHTAAAAAAESAAVKREEAYCSGPATGAQEQQQQRRQQRQQRQRRLRLTRQCSGCRHCTYPADEACGQCVLNAR